MSQITTDNANERVGRKVNGVTKKYADEKARTEINKIFTDGAYAGLGFGICSTDAITAAKTVTLANYILLKNMPVNIRFTKGVNVSNATLNINSTGAKPLYIDGVPLQPGTIRAGMTVTVVYDGTNFNITSQMGLGPGGTPSDLYVDMGLPSGLLWAKKNIDLTQDDGFAASEFQYECTFFSWGNVDGHNPISTSAFDYNWGSGNDGPYASTPGAAIRYPSSAGPSYDIARTRLGAPWRLPSTEEYAELFANIDFVQADGETVIDASQTNKLVTVNDIVGIYLKSKNNGNLLFFPCSGYGYGTSWNYRGSRGYYWSSSLYSEAYGRNLGFFAGGVYPQNDGSRFGGFAGRPVQ